jgi:tetratricopeptide (TPR) repeat protein
LLELGEFEHSKILLERVLPQIKEEVYADFDENTGRAYQNLGRLNYLQGNYRKSFDFYDKALNIYYTLLNDENSTEIGRCLYE